MAAAACTAPPLSSARMGWHSGGGAVGEATGGLLTWCKGEIIYSIDNIDKVLTENYNIQYTCSNNLSLCRAINYLIKPIQFQ
jgi:hypothetical protein